MHLHIMNDTECKEQVAKIKVCIFKQNVIYPYENDKKIIEDVIIYSEYVKLISEFQLVVDGTFKHRHSPIYTQSCLQKDKHLFNVWT